VGKRLLDLASRHLHYAPAHNALSVEQFLAINRTSVLQHPSYSTDFAPCDFWLISKLKNTLKATHFKSVEAVKIKSKAVLKAFPALFQPMENTDGAMY